MDVQALTTNTRLRSRLHSWCRWLLVILTTTNFLPVAAAPTARSAAQARSGAANCALFDTAAVSYFPPLPASANPLWRMSVQAQRQSAMNFAAMGEVDFGAFGYSLAGAGDVNGDSYPDLVVGASAIGTSTGKLYVFHGGPSGLSGSAASPAFSIMGEEPYNFFGRAVAGAGDVNGDGFADVVVSAYGASGNIGKIYVFHGGPSGLSGSAANPAFSAMGEAANNYFGTAVAGVGDVNRDGYDDVAVSAQGFSNFAGKLYVFHGGPSGLTGSAAAPAFAAVGEAAGGIFGVAVAGAGDVNGDGYADVVAATPVFNSETGKAYVFHGGPAGLTGSAASPAFSTTGEAVNSYFGSSIAGAGDVNGDGYDDVVIGASDFNDTIGKVYVFHGGATGLTGNASNPAFGVQGNWPNGGFGGTVAGAGDVNGDSYADVIVSAGTASGAGKVYVFHGGSSGLIGSAASPAYSAVGEAHGDVFGSSLAGIGDVNKDGYADVAVGAVNHNRGTGKVYAYYMQRTERVFLPVISGPISDSG